MLLNEDYFDKIEITDDDIDSPDSDTAEYATPEDWFNSIQTKYDCFLSINIKKKDVPILTDDELWSHQIQKLIKRFQYILNIYGIDYSEPTIQDSPDWYILDNYKTCNFIDFHQYKLISDYKTIPELSKYNLATIWIKIVYFVNLPKVKTYNAVCQFIHNITKQLWKNEFFGKYYNDLNICLFKKKYGEYLDSVILYNICQHPQLALKNNDTDLIELVDLIHMFFTDHSPLAIKEELSKNFNQILQSIYGDLTYRNT